MSKGDHSFLGDSTTASVGEGVGVVVDGKDCMVTVGRGNAEREDVGV